MTLDPDLTRSFLAFRDHGDPAGIAEVFDATAAELKRIAVHLVQDHAAADDLVGSTFLAAIEVAPSFRADLEVVPWLVGILKKQALMVQRRQRRRPDPQRLIEATPDDPVRSAEDREFDGLVDAALKDLPEVYRPVLELHLKHGLIASEIASALGRPAGTVRTQIVRGLERLRELLPVGLAGLVAGLLPAQGFAAVRDVVIAKAAGSKGVITGTAIGGSLVMKKLILGAAALFVLVFAVWSLDPWSDGSNPGDAQFVGPGVAVIKASIEDAAVNGKSERAELATSGDVSSETPAAKSGVLRGVVRGPDGAVVANARVFTGRVHRVGNQWSEGIASETLTDADGRFELEQDGTSFQLIAAKDDLMSKLVVQGDLQGRREIDGLVIELGQTAMAEGILVDAAGQPIKGHPVRSYFTYGMGSQSMTAVPGVMAHSAIENRVETDSEGRFRVRLVKGRSYGWEVQHPDFPMLRDHHGTDDSPFELRLDAGQIISGRVLRANGTPAVGAEVVINDHPRRSALCAADGTFRLSGVAILAEPRTTVMAHPVGQREVHEIDGPYLKITDQASAIHILPLQGATTKIDVRLEDPLRIAGRVVDEDGEPIGNADVSIEGDRIFDPGFGHSKPSTWEWAHSCDKLKTDDAGMFAFEQLYPGQFKVFVKLPGDKDVPLQQLVPAGSEQILFRVDPSEVRGVVLTGNVRDALTKEVILTFSLTPWYEDVSFASNHDVIAKDGEFEFRGIKTGRIRFSFAADGYASRQLEWQDYKRGVYRVAVELSPVRSLDVRVQDAVGEEVRQFTVKATSHSGEMLSFDIGSRSTQNSLATRNGVARLRGLPAERVTVHIEVRGVAQVDELVDLTSPRDEPVVIYCGERPDPVFVDVMILCADKGADVSDLEALFAIRDKASWRKLMRIALERKDVWFPDGSVSLELRSSDLATRKTLATLEYKGTKEVSPGVVVPQYRKSEQRFDGVGYSSSVNRMPGMQLGHSRQRLELIVSAQGYSTFKQSIEETEFRRSEIATKDAAAALAILRRQ